MLHPADVEVNGAPIADGVGIKRQLRVVRIAEPEEVPRGIDEGVHRVGLAPCGTSAIRTLRVDEFRNLAERRVPAAAELDDLREQDGQAV
jgi:hypothetical protein